MGKLFSKHRKAREVLIEESDETYEVQGRVVNPNRQGDDFKFVINDGIYTIKDAWNNRMMVMTLLATPSVKCVVKGMEVLSIHGVGSH